MPNKGGCNRVPVQQPTSLGCLQQLVHGLCPGGQSECLHALAGQTVVLQIKNCCMRTECAQQPFQITVLVRVM